MFIEFLDDDFSNCCHLVNKITERVCFQRIDLLQGYEEYGNGNQLFFFEAAGKNTPFVLDLIHANTKNDAENIIKEKYKERFNMNTIIPLEIKLVVDER
mgnify:CR=1 FL=1|jgi:hypothetical protein